MSVSVVHDDNIEGELFSERIRPSCGTSPINDRDLSLNLVNGQASHASDEAAGFRVSELLLPSGEWYSGTLLGNMAEGQGKYVWSDGCTYEGEWRRGMRHGNGKISWPSRGAVYEGEFSGGYMHGTGSYIGPDNLTYKGQWKLNLKHGLGYQTFPNGDHFEGSWIHGAIEGPGKYVWANENVYVGNMKRGKMHGKGVLTWRNRDAFEGNWLDGMMHGYGVYRWKDSSFYIGTWTRGLKDGKGSLYPRGSKVPVVQELYINALRKRGVLPNFRTQSLGSSLPHSSSVDMGSTKISENLGSVSGTSGDPPNIAPVNLEQSRSLKVSSDRRWNLEVANEKVVAGDMPLSNEESGNEEKVDVPILEREYMQGVLISELVISNKCSSSRREKKRHKKLKDIKMPGETIIKGHRSYDLMLCLQLGIRYTVGKTTPIQRREVRASDFGSRASFWMNFPKGGSQLTPSHYSEDFKWKDYCPMVFRNLRDLFRIDAADYMMSICGSSALRELSSPGKSGSVFFLSQDDRFMIKTLRKSEVQVLLRMLPYYHHHVRTYENTLITKFFGLHRVIPSSGQKFRFAVMGNIFCTELRIHRRFDFKGSSQGRSSKHVEIDENTTLKDLDLNYDFYLEPSWRGALLKQIEIDSKFLEKHHIMDYSLLLGVHYRAPQILHTGGSFHRSLTASADGLRVLSGEDVQEDEISNFPQGLVLIPRGSDKNSVVVGPHIRGSRLRASAAGDEEVDLLLPGARLQIQLGVNMPARAEHIPSNDGTQMFHEVYDVVIYLGIIDILQDYNVGKRIEHAYKSLKFDHLSISAVHPRYYSKRFLDFVQAVFPCKSLAGSNPSH
ncbi:phosphatidylinositol 4-phosphate 5-kinase 9-like [Iris pallida]|uniref:1-phosphatidylinositol-4-phosphate 5-kinase n=1 Tax=Iris pallida TaxID=29817 RepID=A0AAX6DLB4_IRIPA|nr:phosphatidylinositol 4-phosphate 5-kinase 9-like [Iris pallida]KAJ6821510.1 phosphatidylinositol 4-phosphate 5-kinase 9-like [Iris pallida]